MPLITPISNANQREGVDSYGSSNKKAGAVVPHGAGLDVHKQMYRTNISPISEYRKSCPQTMVAAMSGLSLPRMPWYPADFTASTKGWPLVARAIYRELLDAAWTMGGFPNDVDVLCRIAGATPEEWSAGWPLVKPKFTTGDDGLLYNRRLEKHRVKAVKAYRDAVDRANKMNKKLGRTSGGNVVPFQGQEK